MKSAATPDFLLENLPETVIDWVEEVSSNPEPDLVPSQGVLQPGVVPTSNKDGSENNRVEKDGSVKNEVGKNGAKKVENCVETGKGKESPNLKVKTRERSRRVRLELAVDVLTLIGYHPLQVFLATMRTLELGKLFKVVSRVLVYFLIYPFIRSVLSCFLLDILIYTRYQYIYWTF